MCALAIRFFPSSNGLMVNLIFIRIRLTTADATTLYTLCINNTLASTDIRTVTFWESPSSTYETQRYFRSNPVYKILKLVKRAYTFVSLPSLDHANAISTTKLLEQLVSMNCNEHACYFFTFLSAPLSCRAWAKGYLIARWLFYNIINIKKRIKISNYDLTQDFNNFSVKVGTLCLQALRSPVTVMRAHTRGHNDIIIP